MNDEEELSARERARIKARERKSRPPRMVVDNAGVKRIQSALQKRARASRKKDGS
jgi:hypothetical protein